MKRLPAIVAALYLVAVGPIARAGDMTGNEILELDQTDGAFWLAGWLAGFQEEQVSLAFGKNLPSDAAAKVMHVSPCIPEGATAKQAYAILRKYLNENPNIRHLPATELTFFALETAWPCPR